MMKRVQLCIFYMFLQFTTYDVIAAATVEEVSQHRNWNLLENGRCGNSNTDRIIGGKNAGIGWYPWIARIGYVFGIPSARGIIEYSCAGSLINELYIVTAAHCVSKLPFGTKVGSIRLGEHNTETNPDCEHGYCAEPVQDFEPASIIVHKNYDRPPLHNDIALIRLKKPVNFTEFVRPICLPRGDLLIKDFEGKSVEVAGWGIENIGTLSSSTILQTVKLPVVDIAKCVQSYGRKIRIDDTQLCVGGDIGKDSCGGDSGGPMMKVESLGGAPKYFLLGIVSFGIDLCGSKAIPAVYTSVTRYVKWILDNIRS